MPLDKTKQKLTKPVSVNRGLHHRLHPISQQLRVIGAKGVTSPIVVNDLKPVSARVDIIVHDNLEACELNQSLDTSLLEDKDIHQYEQRRIEEKKAN